MKLMDVICRELGLVQGEKWVGCGVHQTPPIYKIEDNMLFIYHEYSFEDGYSWEEASMADYVALIKGGLKPDLL